MAEKRNADEEIVKQCCDFFNREYAHWSRLAIKKTPISEEEYRAQEEIITAVFRVAEAAVLKIDQPTWRENLKFDYLELQMEMQFYRRVMQM